MAAPQIQDRNGRPLSVGDRVAIDHKWEAVLTHLCPNEGDSYVLVEGLNFFGQRSFKAEPISGRCPDLELIDQPAGGEG